MTTRFGARRRRWVTALALSFAAAAGLTIGPMPSAHAAQPCGPVMFVVPGYTDGGALGMLNAATAPEGANPVRIPYPNAQQDVNLWSNVDIGVANLRTALYNLYVTSGCDLNTRVIIAGFSEGALIAGNVLETEPPDRNIQGILLADGRRQKEESNWPGDPGGVNGYLPFPGPGGGFRPLDSFHYPTLSLCNGPNSPNGADPVCFGGQNLQGYFSVHPFYNFDLAHELGVHGAGPYPNNLRNRVIP